MNQVKNDLKQSQTKHELKARAFRQDLKGCTNSAEQTDCWLFQSLGAGGSQCSVWIVKM